MIYSDRMRKAVRNHRLARAGRFDTGQICPAVPRPVQVSQMRHGRQCVVGPGARQVLGSLIANQIILTRHLISSSASPDHRAGYRVIPSAGSRSNKTDPHYDPSQRGGNSSDQPKLAPSHIINPHLGQIQPPIRRTPLLHHRQNLVRRCALMHPGGGFHDIDETAYPGSPGTQGSDTVTGYRARSVPTGTDGSISPRLSSVLSAPTSTAEISFIPESRIISPTA